MRRTAARTAATFLAALVIGGPLAGTAAAGTATIRCAVASPPPACALLDDLAATLAPVAPILGTDLASLVGTAQGFPSRSDSASGVPVAEVASVSNALLDELRSLPASVSGLLGAAALGDLTGTLDALVGALAAPSGGQTAAGTSNPTPANTAPSSSAPAAPRSSGTSSFGGSASTGGTSSSPSSAAVPDVPVGDPLLLAPLALPDFGFSQTLEPVDVGDLSPAPAADAAEVALADAVDAMAGGGRGAELAVVVVLSLLLIAGAGVAQLQAQRHTIPD
jgi:hypothetical protein